MKTYFPLSCEGYVTAYLTTEPQVLDFVAPFEEKDQLKFEHDMREVFYREPEGYPASPRIGALAPNGMPWIFYAQNRNPYLDFSIFYFTLKRASFPAMTVLVSDRARVVRARIWSYCAYDLWLNGEHIARETVPVYQPIRHTDLTLSLREGENDCFFAIQNFGVRDTRNMLSFELLDTDGIKTTLPVEEPALAHLAEAEAWFCSLRADESARADGAPPIPVTVTLDKTPSKKWETGDTYPLGKSFSATFEGTVEGQCFRRVIERYAEEAPVYRKRDGDGVRDNARCSVLAATSGEDEEGRIFGGVADHTAPYIALCNILLTGRIQPEDERCIRRALAKIRQRIDCSDFGLSVILRMAATLPLSDELQREIRDTALEFRYWMDEEGSDAMCFWSENHSLLFHGCQMLAGKLYPNESFLRSGRSGSAQYLDGYRRVSEWFDVVEKEGFEEFCAGGYMAVTLAAVLVIYDFGGEVLRPRAKAVLDRIFREAALQSFGGIHLSPMGRIYRTALCPYRSGLQAMLHMVDDSAADGHDYWGGVFGFSDYRVPEGLRDLMKNPCEVSFNDGRAWITTRKTENTYLTSVASPRPTPVIEPDDTTTEYYRTKLMNESFHGTTLFVPGKIGYQQHLWYAALSDRFYTFVNLPGSERDFCSMRPGYWYGNAVFPAIRQTGRELFCHYEIPDFIPAKFTHAYFPAYAAEETAEAGGYRFARVGDGYLALWCSAPLVLWNGDAVQGADLRAYGEHISWYVKVGSAKEDGSFARFRAACLGDPMTTARVAAALKG